MKVLINGTASDHLVNGAAKCGLLNVCTQTQRGLYTSVYLVCRNNTQGSIILDVPLFHVCTCTWVVPPYFLKATYAKILIGNLIGKFES